MEVRIPRKEEKNKVQLKQYAVVSALKGKGLTLLRDHYAAVKIASQMIRTQRPGY